MDASIPGKKLFFFYKVAYMFLIKEIVLLVENELILLNLFEWRAVSVLFLQTFNPKLQKQCSATGCSADLYTNGSYS